MLKAVQGPGMVMGEETHQGQGTTQISIEETNPPSVYNSAANKTDHKASELESDPLTPPQPRAMTHHNPC